MKKEQAILIFIILGIFLVLFGTVGVFATCTDSDVNQEYPDGLNYYAKGSVSLSYGTPVYDYCSSANKNQLVEKYCAADIPEDAYYICYNGCKEGACINITASANQTEKKSEECVQLISSEKEDCSYTPIYTGDCITGYNEECNSSGFFQQIINWFKRLFGVA